MESTPQQKPLGLATGVVAPVAGSSLEMPLEPSRNNVLLAESNTTWLTGALTCLVVITVPSWLLIVSTSLVMLIELGGTNVTLVLTVKSRCVAGSPVSVPSCPWLGPARSSIGELTPVAGSSRDRTLWLMPVIANMVPVPAACAGAT